MNPRILQNKLLRRLVHTNTLRHVRIHREQHGQADMVVLVLNTKHLLHTGSTDLEMHPPT